jgi:hypothetical protein
MMGGGKHSAASHDCVDDLAGHLVEHQPLDGTEPFAVAIVDGRSLHAVAWNQGVSHGDLPMLLIYGSF